MASPTLAALVMLALTVPSLGPEARAVIAPVFDAIAKEREAQAHLPPPATDADRLVRAFRLQQAGRIIVIIDFSKLKGKERINAEEAAEAAIRTVDHEAQRELKRLMPKRGWFLRSKYGEEAATAAFIIAQHAGDDVQLQRDALKRMAPLVGTKEIDSRDYALLYDRVSYHHDRKPQRFGTQITCVDGRTTPAPISDAARVDERRRAIGFETTLAQYLKLFPEACSS